MSKFISYILRILTMLGVYNPMLYDDNRSDEPDTESNLLPEAPESPPLYIDDDGWLVGEGVVKVASARCYSSLDTKDSVPTHIVWHTTSTKRGTAASLAERIKKLPPKGESGSSWHVCIGSDGTIYQSVSFEKGSWHAGGRTAAKINGKSYNRFSVGIEVENLGRVVECKDGSLRAWPFLKPGYKPGPIVKRNDTFIDPYDDRMYHRFPEPQLAACKRLQRILREMYGSLKEVGHYEVDPTRKEDPGQWFMVEARNRFLDVE